MANRSDFDFTDQEPCWNNLYRTSLLYSTNFASAFWEWATLKGDAGFKIRADAEQLVASTFSLLQEMNLEADARRDDAGSQHTQDQEQANQRLRTA